MSITLKELLDKFVAKGMLYEFHVLVPKPELFIVNPCTLLSSEAQVAIFKQSVEDVYGPEWDYWSTWIDYQQHKF